MKKVKLTVLLALLSGCLAFGLTACGKDGDDSSTPDVPPVTLTDGVDVVFPEVDGISFVTDDLVNGQIERGETLNFTVDLSSWKGATEFTLLAGEDVITPDQNGEYSLKIEEAVTFRFGDVTVTFEEAEGVRYVSDYQDTAEVPFGSMLSFSLNVSPFYTEETAIVRAGTRYVTANDEGVYTFQVSSDITITVLDVVKEEASCTSGGQADNPFFIYTPADWIYIAEQINSGNPNYVNAHYQLEADLDFKGETIPVMGDATLVNSGAEQVQTYFGGFFNGRGHTIKNFNIEETGKPYVGLFGYVVASIDTPAYGTIADLHVENFSISAVMNRKDEDVLAAGGIIGFGIGANVYNCTVSDARIEITGNDNYPSFIGGAVGLLQTAYIDMGTEAAIATSQIAYVDVKNTDVLGNSGIIPAAGGIVGYTYAPHYLAPASILNCYADNTFVYGAVHTGGIVGQISANSSVFNTYFNGIVTANTDIRDAALLPNYCYAYAGGIVGYAENETAIANSFSTATLDASAPLGGKYQYTDGIVAKVDAAGTYEENSIAAVLKNNYYAEGGVSDNLDLTDSEFVLKTLGWHEFDWLYEEGALYPTFNTAQAEPVMILNAVYVGSTVSGQTTKAIELENSYFSLAYLIVDGTTISEYIQGDNGKTSFGFFFDEACTQPVPFSYVFTAMEQTIYVGFVSYAQVAGEYAIQVSPGKTVWLSLLENGIFQYEDGGVFNDGIYRFDGEKILFEDARFARYAYGGSIENLYQLDLYDFTATIAEDGSLNIYGGSYTDSATNTTVDFLPKSSPLIASKNFGFDGEYYFGETVYSFSKDWTVKVNNLSFTYQLKNGQLSINNGENGTYNDGAIVLNGNALIAMDSFKGEWVLSAAENYKLTFDGMGNWSVVLFGYDRTQNTPAAEIYQRMHGTYTVDAETAVATLTNTDGDTYTVKVDEEGFLAFTGNNVSLSLGRVDGYKGEWLAVTNRGNVALRLNGISHTGNGEGEIAYWDGNVYPLVYAMENGRITLYNGKVVFGYMVYNLKTDTFNAYLYDSETALIDETNATVFYHFDVFTGEWVGEHAGVELLDFNGLGNYDVGLIGMAGKLTIGNEKIAYELDNNTLSTSFTYAGVTYNLFYNVATGTLQVTNGDVKHNYERKDEYAGVEIVDLNGTSYAFDGRGNLENGGILTVTAEGNDSKSYNYKITASGVTVTDNGEAYATITVKNNTYVWTVNGTETNLYIMNRFVGTWAVSGNYGLMTLQPMDLLGKMQGTYNGRVITVTYNKETGICSYGNNYLVPLENNEFAISAEEVIGTEYQICAPVDTLFGTTWTQKTFTTTDYRFDGVGMSKNGSGKGQQIYGGSATNFSYEYLPEYGVYRLVIEENGNTSILLLEFCDVNTKSAYVNTEKTRAFTLSTIDELYMVEAIEESTGYTYTFDGRYSYSVATGGVPGTVTVTDKSGNVVTTYKYLLTKRLPLVALIEMTLTAEDGTVYNATFSYKTANFTISKTLAE